MATIKVVNVRNGKVAEMELSHWNNIKNQKLWKGVFKPLNTPEPPEVTKLRQDKKNSAKRKKVENNEGTDPKEVETEPTEAKNEE